MLKWKALPGIVLVAFSILGGLIYYYTKVYVPRDAQLALALNSLALNMPRQEVDLLFPANRFPRVEFGRASGGSMIVVSSDRRTLSDKDSLASLIGSLQSSGHAPHLDKQIIISLDTDGLVDAYYWDDTCKVRDR